MAEKDKAKVGKKKVKKSGAKKTVPKKTKAVKSKTVRAKAKKTLSRTMPEKKKSSVKGTTPSKIDSLLDERKISRRKRAKKKTNLLRLCSEMNKYCFDAVDKEVVKRFRTLIETSEEDVTKSIASAILKDPKNADISIFHESFQPYIKHYVFLVKRGKKKS